jgi:hypothetical protein
MGIDDRVGQGDMRGNLIIGRPVRQHYAAQDGRGNPESPLSRIR